MNSVLLPMLWFCSSSSWNRCVGTASFWVLLLIILLKSPAPVAPVCHLCFRHYRRPLHWCFCWVNDGSQRVCFESQPTTPTSPSQNRRCITFPQTLTPLWSISNTISQKNTGILPMFDPSGVMRIHPKKSQYLKQASGLTRQNMLFASTADKFSVIRLNLCDSLRLPECLSGDCRMPY